MDQKRSRQLIRDLAEQVAQISHLPEQQEKRHLWKELNHLRMKRPMVMIYSFPWCESEKVSEDLVVLSDTQPFQSIERSLRRLLFKWRMMKADMVVSPLFYTPLYLKDPGIRFFDDAAPGAHIITCGNVHMNDNGNPDRAVHYPCLIRDEADLSIIVTPHIEVDEEKTRIAYEQTLDLLDPILCVEKSGVKNIPFNPVDELAKHWGITSFLMDMTDRPELVHQAMEKLTDAYIACMEQCEKLGLLSPNSLTGGVITQGMGESFTDELPRLGVSSGNVTIRDLWGGSAAQIFSCVSPAMHEEFALQHEKKFLHRFGLTSYGCCEPLHKKIDILRGITNLRKISMSSWIDIEEAAENLRGDYVFSYRPNPSFLAVESFDLQPAREELQKVLLAAARHGCQLELILRTIITYRSEPERMARWTDMAMQMVQCVW